MDSIMQAETTPRPCPQTGRWKGRAALAGASLAFVLGAAHFFRSGQHGLFSFVWFGPGCSGGRRPGCDAVPRSSCWDWPRSGA